MMVPGIIIVASKILNSNSLPVKFNFANAKAAMDETNVPPNTGKIIIFIVFRKPLIRMDSPMLFLLSNKILYPSTENSFGIRENSVAIASP